MSFIQPSTVHAIAQSLEVGTVSDEAAQALSPDVEYRLREVVQVCTDHQFCIQQACAPPSHAAIATSTVTEVHVLPAQPVQLQILFSACLGGTEVHASLEKEDADNR